MGDELLRCPFCLRPAGYFNLTLPKFRESYRGQKWEVCCLNADCAASIEGNTKKEVMGKWNNRKRYKMESRGLKIIGYKITDKPEPIKKGEKLNTA